jgi:predicted transcriptional regulator
MNEADRRLERLTILLPADDARQLKHFAVDNAQSASAIVRTALKDFMHKSKEVSDSDISRLETKSS